MNLNLIKPKVKGESDKYSWNLYKYLHKYKGNTRVYYNKSDIMSSDKDSYNKNTLRLSDILVGTPVEHEDSVIGNSLLEILRKVPSQQYWYQSALITYSDITEEFYNDYIDIGRCLIDNSHTGWLRNTDNRFTYINDNERKCNWCGIEQHREVEEVIKHVTNWI